MTCDEVMALSDKELRIEAAKLMGFDEDAIRYMQVIPDYHNDIAAAMDLALSIGDRYWMELHTPFRIGDPFFAGFTPLGTGGWNGRPDNQCEAEKPACAITRAFVLVLTSEGEERRSVNGIQKR